MRERGLQITLMCLGVAVAAYAGCSSSDTTTGGTTTGDTTTTTTTTTSTTTSTSTSATSSGSGTTATGNNLDNLGIECGSDVDCGANLKCLTADGNNAILGGGPANGYCSKDCATETDCPGDDAACVGATAGKPGICLLTCTPGPALMSLDEQLDPAKCHGREDVRCSALTTPKDVTVCVPSCGRDDQCPAGRFCDQRSSQCVAMPSTGLPLGAKCNQQASPPECAGICVSFGGGVTMCSSPCVLGGEIDPNDLTTTTDCGGLDKGVCAYSSLASSGLGDLGFCAEACEKQDDCQNPAFWCRDVGLPKGYCLGPTPCPKGQTDCKNPDICTDTKYGPFCTNPKFPLGDAAPGSTTSSSSASSSSASGAGGSMGSTSGAGGSMSSAGGAGGSMGSASTGP